MCSANRFGSSTSKHNAADMDFRNNTTQYSSTAQIRLQIERRTVDAMVLRSIYAEESRRSRIAP